MGYHYSQLTRKELVEYFATLDPNLLNLKQMSDPRDAIMQLPRNTVIVLFEQDYAVKGDFPSQIIVPEEDLDDFFAWSTTFVDSIRPITSLIPVKSRNQALTERKPPQISSRILNGILAVTIMDALLQSRSTQKLPEAIIPFCQRTLSAVFLQMVIGGLLKWEIADCASMWLAIRDSLSSPKLVYDASYILEVWAEIGEVVSDSGFEFTSSLTRTLRRTSVAGSRETSWDGPSPTAIPSDLDIFLRAPREERLLFVRHQLKAVVNQKTRTPADAAFCGYLLSLVADGDFSLWPIAIDFQDLPTMPLWFAYFTGVHEKSNVGGFAQSISRRFLSLLKSQSTPVDIDAREFLIGRRSKGYTNSSTDFPLSGHNILSVRLSDGVRAWFSTRDASSSSEERRSTTKLEAKTQASTAYRRELEQARQLAESLLRAIGNISTIANDAAPDTKSSSTRPSNQSSTMTEDTPPLLFNDQSQRDRGAPAKKNRRK